MSKIKKEKEMFEAAKELYEKLHSLDYYGDNFDRWENDFDSLEDYLRATINREIFTILYDGNQSYEFAFTYSYGSWYMGINLVDGYYCDDDIDEIKEIMDAIIENKIL